MPSLPTDSLAIVCSGGGIYGAAQAGMIAELARHGVRPHVMVGVSAGALNSAFMAQDWSVERAEELVAIWGSVDKREVFPSGVLSQLAKILARRDAIQSAKGLEALVERFAPLDISACPIPLHVGATDLVTGEMVWWADGESVPRLCASAALPGVIPPVTINGRPYIDGGVIDNLPVAKAIELGASTVLCLDVSSVERDSAAPDSALGVLLRAYAHTRHALQEARAHHHIASGRALHLTATLPQLNPDDFSHSLELVELGRRAAAQFMETHKEAVLYPTPKTQEALTAFGRLYRRLNRPVRIPRRNPTKTDTPTTRDAPLTLSKKSDKPSSANPASSASVSPIGVVARTAQSIPNGHSDLNSHLSPET